MNKNVNTQLKTCGIETARDRLWETRTQIEVPLLLLIIYDIHCACYTLQITYFQTAILPQGFNL